MAAFTRRLTGVEKVTAAIMGVLALCGIVVSRISAYTLREARQDAICARVDSIPFRLDVIEGKLDNAQHVLDSVRIDAQAVKRALLEGK